MKLLAEEGVDFERVDYYVEPLTEEKLRTLLEKGDLRPRDVLRTRERLYKELGLDAPEVDDEAIVRALVEHPDLLQRPIVEGGGRAVLGRPLDNVRILL